MDVRLPKLPSVPLPGTFVKASPAVRLALFSGGRRQRLLAGTTWVWVWQSLALVPASVQSVPYSFEELTSDSQRITVQGDLKVLVDADTALERFDLTVDTNTLQYTQDNALDLLYGDVRSALQRVVRELVAAQTLKENLTGASALEASAFTGLQEQAASLQALGFTVQQLSVSRVVASDPKLTLAFEAETREALLAASDKATADRRQKAAESDRAIREYEAKTAHRLEQERAKLVEEQGKNEIAKATADAEASQKRLDAYKGADPAVLVALALEQLAKGTNVENLHFGNLSDLLGQLTKKAA